MKIDFSVVLQDLDGKDISVKDVDNADVPLTLALAAITGLMRIDPKDDGKVRYDLYKLTKRVGDGGVVELEPKEAELIKTRIGMAYGQLVVGPAWDILNG